MYCIVLLYFLGRVDHHILLPMVSAARVSRPRTPQLFYRFEDIVLKIKISNYENKSKRARYSETSYMPFD